MKYSCDRDRIHLPLLFVCLFFFTLISFYCRDVTFPIFILFYYRDGAFSSLISFYFMWWNISDLDYHFTTVMWLFPPWHHFTTVMDHFVPWPHFTTVMEHFLPEYYFTQYRDRIFSTLIIIHLCRDVPDLFCLAEHFYTAFIRWWPEFVSIVRRYLGCSHAGTLYTACREKRKQAPLFSRSALARHCLVDRRFLTRQKKRVCVQTTRFLLKIAFLVRSKKNKTQNLWNSNWKLENLSV